MPETDAVAERAPAPPGRAGLFAVAAFAVAALVGGVVYAGRGDAWQRSGPPIRVSSWAPYWQPDAAMASFRPNADLFADLSIVAYSATDATTISAYPGLPDGTIETYRAAASAAGVPLLATIFDDSPAGAMAAVLADPASRAAHVQAVVGLVAAGGFDGVDLDYEKFAFSDDRGTWATTRPNWIAFLTELGAALDATGAQLVVSVPPVYDDGQTADSGYWVYDYASMGAVVDRIRVMAYDYSFTGSAPGPIAPIDWVHGLVEAIADLVAPDKVDLGIPTYGYDWVLSVSGTCPADQTPETKAMSTSRAARTVAERGIVPLWDPVTEERVFTYTDTLTGTDATGAAVTCTVAREVHYLDAVAVHRRAWIAHRADLHGVALWALGNDDDLTWEGIRAVRLGDERWGEATTTTVPASAPASAPATAPATGG
jgi:spore germination protein YaaH